MKNPFLNIAALLCLFTAISILGPVAFAQEPDSVYTDQNIKMHIREVFADQADAAVFKNNQSKRRAMIYDFFERVQIKNKPGYRDKKIPLLSKVELRTTDNAKLKRDEVFDPRNFNALKYNFPMSAKEKKLYRVDGTDYLIVIHPKK